MPLVPVAAPSSRNSAFYSNACTDTSSRTPLAPLGHSDARTSLLASPSPLKHSVASSDREVDASTLHSLGARLVSAAEALSRTATPTSTCPSSPVVPRLNLPTNNAEGEDHSWRLPLLRTRSQHREESPARPALRLARTEPPPRIVRFAGEEAIVGLTWCNDDYERRGPPPVARLSMREVIELQAVKASAGVTIPSLSIKQNVFDVTVDTRRGL